jgi:beta-mannanase
MLSRSKLTAPRARRLRSWRWGAVAVTPLLLATAISSPLLSSGASTSVAGTPAVANAPGIPASGQAYLGAFVDPTGQALTSSDPNGGVAGVAQELSALPSLNQSLARPLSIVPVSMGWGDALPQSQLDQVFASGAMPMITWNCGDIDNNVSAGADDALISGLANQLAASGMPIFLRWFADPNLDSAASRACLGTDGATGYVQAYQHIHALFAAAGASNVSFVWSVDTTDGGDPQWGSYYPGESAVDWIAADGYDESSSPPPAGTVSAEFGTWYSQFSTDGKPLMISGTGALPGTQSQYIQQLATELPTQFPLVQSLIYTDAPDMANGNQYQLDTIGLTSFGDLSQQAFLRPTRAATSTTVQATPRLATPGSTMQLAAVVTGADGGGNVSFFNGTTPITGCSALPLSTPSCSTSSLPTGESDIVAQYNGDSGYAPSHSADFTVNVSSPMSVTTSTTGVTNALGSGVGPAAGSTGPGGAASVSPAVQKPTATNAANAALTDTLGAPPGVPGTGQAYLGAFDDPAGSVVPGGDPTVDSSSLPAEIAALPAFNESLSQATSIVPVYTGWNDPVLNTQLDQIVATGAIPMVTWNCGVKDSWVASGGDDQVITAFAQQLAAWGLPVFLRWFPDPNNPNSLASKCLDDGGIGGGAAGYVAAYDHIYSIVSAIAPNVSFVWSVDLNVGGAAVWQSYYPASTPSTAVDVDWAAADISDKTSNPPLAQLSSWYNSFDPDGKPMMLSQVAALPAQQQEFLQDLGADIPSTYPDIKALIYLDAPVDASQFQLGQQGLAAFQQLSGEPTFLPPRTSTSTTDAVSSNPIPANQVEHITAAVNAGDMGGSVSFLDNGTVIAGCGTVPINDASSCDTSSLPQGQNNIEVVYSGDASYNWSYTSALSLTVTSPTAFQGPPAIPGPGHAYLGAWVKPTATGNEGAPKAAIKEELSSLPKFDSGLTRPLSIVHMYQRWADPVTNAQIEQVLATGGIPMIDWTCGDTDANIVAGNDDAFISAFARQLASLKTPIFLRWYYEANFKGSSAALTCLAGGGPAGYVQAFRHIHDLFEAAGASNVGFVWTIATSGTDPDVMNYYPGSAYVDWIGADGYYRYPGQGTLDLTKFIDQFQTWYSTFSSLGKPMIVTETAANSGYQAQYLNSIIPALQTQFPLIKGVEYFDAPGSGGKYQFPLDAAGLQAFQNLSANHEFQPTRQASSVFVTVSPAAAVVGQRVRLAALIPNTDLSGSVSYQVNGQPLAGCQSLVLDVTTSCSTTELPSGTNSITAVYNGDAETDGSTSATMNAQVSALRSSGAPTVSAASDAPASTLPPLATFPPFSGLPNIGTVAPFGFPAALQSPDSFGSLLLPKVSDGSIGGGGGNPIARATSILTRGPFGGVLIPIGFALLLLFGAYCITTWWQDRRRIGTGETPEQAE